MKDAEIANHDPLPPKKKQQNIIPKHSKKNPHLKPENPDLTLKVTETPMPTDTK